MPPAGSGSGFGPPALRALDADQQAALDADLNAAFAATLGAPPG